MTHGAKIYGIGVAALMLSGCLATGLSTRETRGHNYSTYLYALYDGQEALDAATRPLLRLPARVAVAQIGEVAPSQEMLAVLRQNVGFFRTVEGIPGVFELERTDQWYGYGAPPKETGDTRTRTQQVKQMVRVAKDLGMDYVFLCGGSIDYSSRQTGLSLLDLTIIGGYVVPSQELKGTARASGALVDLTSERVIFVVSSEAQRHDHASTATLDGAQDRFLDGLREEVITKLTAKLLERMRTS